MADTKVLLMILDGFGHSEVTENNAIAMANAPTIKRLMTECPHTLLETSGKSVGLPDGQMGNSEVGHLNIGGGRIIPQELTRITDFAKNKGFESLPDVARIFKRDGDLHLFGLLSDGGVHSSQDHLFLLLEACARVRKGRVAYLHMVTDGRDTPPQSALEYLAELEKVIKTTRAGLIATVGGRFYMMDRDKRWERTKAAYEALTNQSPPKDLPIKNAFKAKEAIDNSYAAKVTDEFIFPHQLLGGKRISPKDSLICFNFRADRMRQIVSALGLESFSEFPRKVEVREENLITFTQYEDKFRFPVLFKPAKYTKLLGELVAEKGDSQLRIAETEKYAHVTYFFNGGVEAPYKNEDRVLVQSPKEVATYDLKPQMSAPELTDALIKKMGEKSYRLVVLNYANSDMVGHSGNLPAAIKAVEALDQCITKVEALAREKGYELIITADHGNSECMVDPVTHKPHTAHTTNPVPLIWVPTPENLERSKKAIMQKGILADIAPTILAMYGWDKPAEMTGRNLIQY